MSESLPPWDAFQREVLEALGHVVYAARDAAAANDGTASIAMPMHDPADAAAPPLLRALARAGNVTVAALPDLPSIEQLRTPAAKRALWPRLRILRKAVRQ